MLDERAARESTWFSATILCFGVALVAFNGAMPVTTALALAAAAMCVFQFFRKKPTTHRMQRPNGNPDPNDDWFREHPWWEPDPEPEPHCHAGWQGGEAFQHAWRCDRARAKSPYSFSVADARHLLGIPDDATAAQARTAFRRAVLVTHPDRGGDEEAFLKVQAAWERLKPLFGFDTRSWGRGTE
jgi:hypothetical protein